MEKEIYFKVINKDLKLYGCIGKLSERIEGIPALYVLDFGNGERRGYTASEIRPIQNEGGFIWPPMC